MVNDGCHGVSPLGIKWVYAMPEHTGTATVTNFLQHNMNVTTCSHVHSKATFGASFAFALVTNPFRRALTIAAWNGVIDGGRYQLKRSQDENVANFRAWVLTNLTNGQLPFSGGMIRPQADFLSGFPLKFIGRTAQLESGLQHVLTELGYVVSVKFNSVHCVSSCPTEKRGTTREQQQRVTNDHKQIEWYNVATTIRVLTIYAKDFERFGFSLAPKDMWDESSVAG